jgi:hypothetical protein
MKFEKIEPDFNIEIKRFPSYFEQRSFYSNNLYWNIFLDNDNSTFHEIKKNTLFSLNINPNLDSNDSNSDYWACAYLIDEISFEYTDNVSISTFYLLVNGLHSDKKEEFSRPVFKFNDLDFYGKTFTISLEHPVLATQLSVLFNYDNYNPIKISGIKMSPKNLNEIYSNGSTVSVNTLRLRESYNVNSKTIKYLEKGQILEVLDMTPHREKIENMYEYWFKVKTQDNLVGWVYGYYISRNLVNAKNYNSIITIEDLRKEVSQIYNDE